MTRGGRFRISVADIVAAYVYAVVPLLLLTKLTLRKEFLYVAQMGPIGLLVFWVLVSWRIRKPGPLGLAAILFLVVLVAGVAKAPSASQGAAYFLSKYGPALSMPLCWFIAGNAEQQQKVLSALLVVSIASAVYSIYQTVIGYPAFEDRWALSMGYVHGLDTFHGDFRRGPGITIFSSANAMLLSAGLFVLLGRLSIDRRKVVNLALFNVITIGLIFSQTRGWWIGTLVGVVFVYMRSMRLRVTFFLRTVLASMAICLAGVTLWTVSDVFRIRLLSFRGMFTDPNHPFFYRVILWSNLVRDHSSAFLVGYGTGTVGTGGTLLARGTMLGTVDNMFLNIFLSVGLPGLVTFVAVIWFALRMQRASPRFDGGLPPGVVLALKGFVIAFLMACITGDYLESFPGNVFFWTVIGILGTNELRTMQVAPLMATGFHDGCRGSRCA